MILCINLSGSVNTGDILQILGLFPFLFLHRGTRKYHIIHLGIESLIQDTQFCTNIRYTNIGLLTNTRAEMYFYLSSEIMLCIF